jgi:chorismate mutase
MSLTPEARIKKLRKKVDAADRALMKALGARMATVKHIGKIKVAAGMPLLQKIRWNAVMDERLKAAGKLGLSEGFTTGLYALIHREALKIQRELKSRKKTLKSATRKSL